MPKLVTSEKNRWKATIPRDPKGYTRSWRLGMGT